MKHEVVKETIKIQRKPTLNGSYKSLTISKKK